MNIFYRNLVIYFGVLFLSVAVFYAVDGRFETDFFGFPTIWTGWFYFLYIAIPFYILILTIYRRLIKKESYDLLKNSIVFLLALSIVHISYWLIVNTYKISLFHEVQAIEAKIKNEISDVNLENVDAQYEFNPRNKNRSYKISFTTLNKSSYKTGISVKGFIAGTDNIVFLQSLLLLPDKKVQNHYFYLSEKDLRDKGSLKGTLDLKISYVVDFPRDKYKPRLEIAQQWCTWSIIGCGNTGEEVVWHNTELFESTIFQLPYKLTGPESPLLQVKLSNFTSLDASLPFTNISFLSEEITRKMDVIEQFVLKFSVSSRTDGYIYYQISTAKHSGKLLTIPLEGKSIISKGENIVSFPVGVNEISALMKKQTEGNTIEFDLFISNNRGWYCPDFVCEIINIPNQLKRFVVSTKNIYWAGDFPIVNQK